MPKINQEEYEILKKLDDKWKWIARDDENQTYSAEIYVFEGKPEREDGYWNNVIAHDYALLEEWDDLFQFIQWEDEPYNIAELIEEYEKDYKGSWEHAIEFSGEVFGESEETEMKTLESIREEIWEEMLRLEDKRKDQWADIKYQTLREVLQKLEHLDEPEVLSQEWISENVEYAYFDMLDGSGRLSSATAIIKPEKLQNLLVPKQEELTDEQIARKVDRAYKDGYEEGKQHATKKQPEETETVARVLVDYLIASAKLKLVLSMEVEELEE